MISTTSIGPYDLHADSTTRPGIDFLQNGINYEPHVVEVLRRYLPSATGFLDIGANIGFHTLVASSINSTLPIYSAEASPANLQLLCHNISSNNLSNVTILPFPLASHPCILRRNDCAANSCCTLDLHATTHYPHLTAALSLDTLNLPPISLVKLDVEGFELAVLQGATRLLATRPTIVFEYCPAAIQTAGFNPTAFFTLLTQHNYHLTRLHGDSSLADYLATPT